MKFYRKPHEFFRAQNYYPGVKIGEPFIFEENDGYWQNYLFSGVRNRVVSLSITDYINQGIWVECDKNGKLL